MTELIFTKKQAAYVTLENILFARTGHGEIAKTPNGKPYALFGGLHFSLSHSGDSAVIALSDKPVGVDFELFTGKSRTAVLSRFTARERSEINSERDFLIHWTAREAYIKLIGGTLAKNLKSLEYYGGNLYICGKISDCEIKIRERDGGIVAVCTEQT